MTENAFRESKVHGKLNFPFTVYHVKMPDFITYYPLHYHKVFELIFVTRGALRVRIMDKEEILYQDDFLYSQNNGDGIQLLLKKS